MENSLYKIKQLITNHIDSSFNFTKKEKELFTLIKGSPCLYRFVKMRSSSAIPPKLVRSAGAAGAEAAEAEKDAEVEVEVDESEDAAPVVDAALLFFVLFLSGECRLESESQRTRYRNHFAHARAGKRESGAACV